MRRALVVLLLLAGSACSSSGEPGTRSPAAAAAAITRAAVLARPWPSRVTPTAAWPASVAGSGDRVTLAGVAGTAPGALGRVTLRIQSADPRPTPSTSTTRPALSGTLNLTLPDGARWYPLDLFRLDATGDLPFTTATASGDSVDLIVGSLGAVLAAAPDPVTAVGRFVSADGRQVDRLALPRTTRIARDCASPPCPAATTEAPTVSLPAQPGTALRARTAGTESGEAAVAGTAHASALGHEWDGMVGAVEGARLTADASWDGHTWSLTAKAEQARQLWVDVWPVADTTLAASSGINNGGHNCLRDCNLRVRWTNTGLATSQIYEAEGLGPAGATIGFDLNKSLGHDAGLGVSRGDRKINLGGGGDVDSNQAPGEKVDRGLSYTPGTDVTIVLRGNFPDVRVKLAIPAG